ncbi:hypothetical protein XYCOK13_39020 [Xylanibacillus composti]|uniref:Spore germination protein KC n=1 Tax=Xylanibacillus composti TaxID=1572762 RepID=A0A8J4H8R1_9BACL|nr:hypothetical protein XYCOK13_39020 [Xylanibacillus composti]
MALLLCLAMLCLTGCWNRKELNELAVVLAAGIDSVDDQYEVSLQIVDPSAMSKHRIGDRSPVLVFSEKAPTIFEALRKMTTHSSRKMYIAHLRFLIVDEKTARTSIQEPMGLWFRDHEARPDFYIAVAKDVRAKDLLGLVTPTEVLPAMDLHKSLKVSERTWAPTAAVNVKELFKALKKEGISPILTGLTIRGDMQKGMRLENAKQPISPAEFQFMGIGVFRDDQLVGWLDETESKALNYIKNKVVNTVGRMKCPDSEQDFVVEVIETETKMDATIKHGQPHVKLDVFVEGNIGEVHCQGDLRDVKVIRALEQAASDELLSVLEAGIHKVQKVYGSDVFGMGEVFHRKYPKQWKEWKHDWNDRFKNDLKVEISIDYQIRKFGKVIGPLEKKEQE